MVRKLLYLLLILNSNFALSETNSHGITGILNTPNARFQTESTLDFSIYRGDPSRKIFLKASPFNWFEASVFYVDITNKRYSSSYNFQQSYKDKGFNAKFLVNQESKYFPAIAIGLNDLAGTGYFTSEYIVFSKQLARFDFTIGLGWGTYSDGYIIDNPLSSLSESFSSRSRGFRDRGGNFDLNNYFSGNDASFFGSIVYRLSSSLSFFGEYDPTDELSFFSRKGFSDKLNKNKFETKMNFGLKYTINKSTISVFNEGNRNLIFQFNRKANFLDFEKNKTFQSVENKSLSRNQHLQKILELNNFGLIKTKQNKDKIYIAVRHSDYENISLANKNIILALAEAENNIHEKDLFIQHSSYGMETNSLMMDKNKTYNLNDLDPLNIVPEFNGNTYSVRYLYPLHSTSFNLVPRVFLASREGFLFTGLMLENNTKILFNEKLSLISNVKYSLVDDFEELNIPPIDTFPHQVRSDIKQYLNRIGSGLKIGRLQLNYFDNYEDNYFGVDIGIIEEMFSGIIFDYLYAPKNKNIMVGFEANFMSKRSYDMRFGQKDFSNEFLRFKTLIKHDKTGINIKLSYGEYIAGDEGLTVDLYRRFNNGVKYGIFFSLTNVSFDQYGEGSFDKGIRFSIPVGTLFGGKRNISNYEWHPLTKDPAALPVRATTLEEIIEKHR
jgi:hypothetical protein